MPGTRMACGPAGTHECTRRVSRRWPPGRIPELGKIVAMAIEVSLLYCSWRQQGAEHLRAALNTAAVCEANQQVRNWRSVEAMGISVWRHRPRQPAGQKQVFAFAGA